MRTIWKPVVFSTILGAAASHPAQAADYKAEITQWVIEPCMEVAAALDVKKYKAETVEMGVKRTHIAKLMVASREAAISQLAGKMKASATWEDRRAVYPMMLKVCLQQFTSRK